MLRCTNCLNENLLANSDQGKTIYDCPNCGAKNTSLHDADRAIYTERTNGSIKHIVVAAIIRRKKKILFINRKNYPFGLSIPSGHINFDEKLHGALNREVLEETGLNLISKKFLLSTEIIDHCKYGGNIHMWHLFDCDCTGNLDTTKEASDFIWIDENDLDSLTMVPQARYILFKAGIIKKCDFNLDIPQASYKSIPQELENSVLNELPMPVLVYNNKGLIVYANNSGNGLMGTLTNDPDFEKIKKSIKKIIDRTLSSKMTLSTNTVLGKESFNIVSTPLAQKNRFKRVSLTIKNISDQKFQEAKDLLVERSSLALTSNSSFSNIIKLILKQTLETLKISGCSLMMVEGDILKVAYRYSILTQKKRKSRELKIGEGIAGWVAAKKTPLSVTDTSKDPLFVGRPEKDEKSLLSIPVISANNIIGVLNFSRPKDSSFTEEEIRIAQTIASKISLAIGNENLYKQLSNDKKTLETVLSTTSDGLILLTRNLELIFANPAAIAINKLTKDEVKNHHINSFIKKTSDKNTVKFLSAVKKSINLKKHLTIEFVSQKGPFKVVKTTFNPIVEKNGRCESVLIGFNDVTNERFKQEQVRKKVKQITTLFKISSIFYSNINQFVDEILSKTQEILDSESAGIFLFNKGFLGNTPANTEIERIIKSQKNALAKSKHGILSNNAKKDLSGDRINHVIMVPLRPNKHTIGCIYAMNKQSHFTINDSRILSIIASRIALSLQTDELIFQLENDRKRVQNIIDNTADGIVAFDKKINEIFWNKAAAQITGFNSIKEYLAKNPETRNSIEQLFTTANKNPGDMASSERIKALNADDQPIWLDVTFSVLKNVNDGKAEYVISVLRDAAKDIELENKQKEFVYTATHELRTPITAIKGYLSMILAGDAGEVTENQKLFFGRAYSSTERLVSLVEDLLQVARLEENKTQFKKEEINGKILIEEVCNDFYQKAKDKGLQIEVLKKNNVLMQGDYNLTKQAVSNLIDNAIKYTKKGNVQISLDQSHGFGYISIIDSGVGVPKKEQATVFDKFHRVFNSESIRAGGTGLGLFIVRNLIEKQGGQISLESKLGQGSTFRISLPLAKK